MKEFNIANMFNTNAECMEFVESFCDKHEDPDTFFTCMCMMFDYVSARYGLNAANTISVIADVITEVNEQLGTMDIKEGVWTK